MNICSALNVNTYTNTQNRRMKLENKHMSTLPKSFWQRSIHFPLCQSSSLGSTKACSLMQKTTWLTFKTTYFSPEFNKIPFWWHHCHVIISRKKNVNVVRKKFGRVFDSFYKTKCRFYVFKILLQIDIIYFLSII